MEKRTWTTLDVGIIAASVSRADIINDAKINGRLLSAQEVAEQENSQINQDCKEQMESPQIKLVQAESNCGGYSLEMELINEFLQV